MDTYFEIDWQKTVKLPSQNYICGHCGHSLASEVGYFGQTSLENTYLYICHFCARPTFIDYDGTQTPGEPFGVSISHIPDENINQLYDEARSCYSVNAFSASVMCCRKLLMHIAVVEEAEIGKSYAYYVGYLETNNIIPRKAKKWVDKIRELGNEANHEIKLSSPDEAQLILTFTGMLLKLIYEMPGLLGEVED